jgi:hypothetical protein
MSNDKIEKGRHLLKMRMKSCKHLGNQDSDLLKVPLEALHSLALQQIGEQESYIEELESKLKSLTEPVTLTRKDHVRIAEETRRQVVIADIWNRFIESQRKNGLLRKKYSELCAKYCCSLNQIEQLKEKLKQYETQTNQ